MNAREVVLKEWMLFAPVDADPIAALSDAGYLVVRVDDKTRERVAEAMYRVMLESSTPGRMAYPIKSLLDAALAVLTMETP